MSFCHKLRCSNSYNLATCFPRPLIFQTINSVRSNSLRLKYQRSKPSGCKDIEVRKCKFVAKTQFLYKMQECNIDSYYDTTIYPGGAGSFGVPSRFALHNLYMYCTACSSWFNVSSVLEPDLKVGVSQTLGRKSTAQQSLQSWRSQIKNRASQGPYIPRYTIIPC